MAGAIVLALGLFAKRPSDWIDEGLRAPEGNGRVYLGLAVATADAQVGASLLVVGFAAQFCASVGAHPPWLSLAVGISAGGAVAATGLLFLVARWRPRAIRIATALWLQTIEWNQWRLRLDEWGMFLDKYPVAFVLLPRHWGRRSEEGVGEYGRRFFGEKLWERLTGGREPPVI